MISTDLRTGDIARIVGCKPIGDDEEEDVEDLSGSLVMKTDGRFLVVLTGECRGELLGLIYDVELAEEEIKFEKPVVRLAKYGYNV